MKALELAISYDTALSRIKASRDEYLAKVSEIDLLLSDIYHEIELESGDAVARAKRYKELETVLKKRREVKTEFSALDNLCGRLGKTQEIASYINKEKLDNKTYTKRISQTRRAELLM